MPGSLEGIRVVDMTTVLMGPAATQVLGDFGADVIKVEPLSGDTSRYVGDARHPGMSAGFLHSNRNKRSIALDLKSPQGRGALLKLVAGADVLIYNVRPDAMARLGLGQDELKAANPRLVICGLTGFAEGGEYSGRPAYDDLIQALSGASALMAEMGDGEFRYMPVLVADRVTGLAAVNAVLAALLHRERTGRGQTLQVTMFETMVPFVLGEHMAGETFVPALGEMGYRRVLSKSRMAWPTKNGHIAAVIYNDKHWRNFFTAIGEPARLTDDPRLADIGTRTRHIDALYSELRGIFTTRTTSEWLVLLEQADIPAARVHTLRSLLDDPHLKTTGFFRTQAHPSEGVIRTMAPNGNWSETPPAIRRHAPRLGEHTREVLREIGYDAGEIETMIAAATAVAEPAFSNAQPAP